MGGVKGCKKALDGRSFVWVKDINFDAKDLRFL
jgi:hypothetical protein